MLRRVMVLTFAVLCAASAAFAQAPGQASPEQARSDARFEIIPMGGYALWAFSQNYASRLTVGKMDPAQSGYYGLALDFNLARWSEDVAQVRVMWRREDTDYVLRTNAGGRVGNADIAIEYWQIGGVGGMRRGNAMPFAAITFGGSRLIADVRTIGSGR